MHTVECNDLREVPPRFVPWTFLPHHWSLAVLRMTSTSPESLGMRLSVASLAVGSGHARLSAYPCELYFTSNCGSRCCCQVHACFRLQCNDLDLANTNARPALPADHLGSACTRGDIIH